VRLLHLQTIIVFYAKNHKEGIYRSDSAMDDMALIIVLARHLNISTLVAA